MNIIIFLVGVIISLMSLLFIFVPSYFKKFFERYLDKGWMLWAVVFRLVIGVLFVLSSKDTRYPHFIFWLGIVTLLSGITLPIIGQERIKKIINWWLDKPTIVQILWALIAFIFGLFIIYSSNI